MRDGGFKSVDVAINPTRQDDCLMVVVGAQRSGFQDHRVNRSSESVFIVIERARTGRGRRLCTKKRLCKSEKRMASVIRGQVEEYMANRHSMASYSYI